MARLPTHRHDNTADESPIGWHCVRGNTSPRSIPRRDRWSAPPQERASRRRVTLRWTTWHVLAAAAIHLASVRVEGIVGAADWARAPGHPVWRRDDEW